MPRHLLIVDDDASIRTSLAEALADNGTMEVRVAEGPHRALAMLEVAAPDVVLSDVRGRARPVRRPPAALSHGPWRM